MSEFEDENGLKQCLEACIRVTENITDQLIQQGRRQQDSSTDAPLTNAALDVNIHTFTIDAAEETLMKELKINLEGVLDENLPRLSKHCRRYLLDLLFESEYDYERHEFARSFNIGAIDPLKRDLQRLLASINAFRAAWNGEQTAVDTFIRTYPTHKDKSGLWGTTLLYSAARNNRLKLVEYLITRAKCSVNAQNQQHIVRALPNAKGVSHDDFDANPVAGSTALHAACYNGHLEVVKYLIKHGANYFLQNHSDETAIINAEYRAEIIQYFRDFLILGYSSESTTLPNEPILEGSDKREVDCIWEYKPSADLKWYPFSVHESDELQKSLQIISGQEFKREIHLRVRSGTYSVSIMKFLRSGKDMDYKQKLAWVRCRGSSILNFDCCALWQMMFITHPSGDAQSTLNMMNLPTIDDSRFVIHLHSWYFCGARINAQLDRTMNNRRKEITLQISYIQSDTLTFNLETFTFTNRDKTITGCIRWIPRMVSNNPRHQGKIIDIDQYETLGNTDPIPLTTSRLKQVSEGKDTTSMADVEGEIDEGAHEDDDSSIDTISLQGTDANIDTSDRAPETPDRGPQSLNEIFNSSNSMANNTPANASPFTSISSFATTDSNLASNLLADDGPVRNIDDCINEKAANSRSAQQSSVVEKAQKSGDNELTANMNQEMVQLKHQNERLTGDLEVERARLASLINSEEAQTAEHEKQVEELFIRIGKMQEDLKEQEANQRKLEEIAKSIRTVKYTNIQEEVVHDFLTPKYTLIRDHLRSKVTNIDLSFADRVPLLVFDTDNTGFIVNVVGFQGHHTEFKAMLERIWSLLNIVQSAKDFYQRELNRTIKRIATDSLPKVTPRTQIWRQYTQHFLQIFKDKLIEYKKNFDEYIGDKRKSLIEGCVLDTLDKPWIGIRKDTDDYLRDHSLMQEIEPTKQKALEEFIKQNISQQHLKLDGQPDPKSIAVIQKFIDNVRQEFQTDPKYRGYEVKHFGMIPKLLERLMLYYSCFKIQLPLFGHADELLDKIDKNVVTTISTSTGSGKSTLLPALLVAEGYDKVIVTQPRRLPCQLICKRVNETMLIDVGKEAKKLAGWAVSGTERNPEGKVLYLTDGLLKERLLYDDNLITSQTKVNKSIVFFIDEVHERSVNIDLCLAFLARLLSTKPELKTKMRIIISSATLDASVPTLFRNIPQVGLAEFKMPQMGTLHLVTKHPRPNENILDVVQELCKKRKRHDQILCFVSSVGEVNKYCGLLNQISRGTIVAHPLVQSQHPNVQQENIEHGTIFFSTTIAETSLTFPCLKYVVDTGMINTPVYDIDSKRTVLKEVRAAESTIKQRLGRLGRTQPGDYYSLYSFVADHVPFPIPQICQSDLMNLEFSLRKSPLQKGLNYLKRFLPDSPSQPAIDKTIEELQHLNILERGPSDELTGHGKALALLPDFGSLAMSKAVLDALHNRQCGHDLICLASILGVLNTTILFKSIPQNLKSPDGDFMTLLNVMNEILLIRQSVPTHQFNLESVCQVKRLTGVAHIIRQALRRYSTLEKLFNLSDQYRHAAQIKSGDWEMIARALLEGYSDNVFVSLRDLHDRNLHFVRYNGQSDTVAVLDLQSTLTRPLNTAPVSLVIARDIRHSTAIRAKAVLSFLGEIKAEWLEHKIERRVGLIDDEDTYISSANKFSNILSKFSHRIGMLKSNNTVSLKGSAGVVLAAELHLQQEMTSELRFTLQELNTYTAHENFTRNLKSVMKMTRIFNPLIWRWQAEKQTEITINNVTATETCEIIVKGRKSDNKKVRQEFASFISWLRSCAVIRHPNAGVSPRVLRPQMRKDCHVIEERIARVTDTKRTDIDLYNGTKGTKATRETRMEVVGWIAVCKFDCRLEGGFVRDWIVGGYIQRPASLITNPKAWIETRTPVPTLNKEVVPCDLDCHLPSHRYFDINKFQDELYKYGITCSVSREDWRYVLLFDEEEITGPFTMDLIEPHVALTHDRIDFDVNNLSLEKDYTHELGMRIDITQKPYGIELEAIVDNIKNKCFQLLRPDDSGMKIRIDKMVQRGWKQTGSPVSILPELHWKCYVILVPLPRTTALYTEVSTKMGTIAGMKILSIEQIRNPDLEETYEGMKKMIKKQCKDGNPNEQELFHGTKTDGVVGIAENGYDDRYFNASGMYGHGAYFADDPKKSHGYTGADAANGNTRVMYYNKVLLGIPSILTAAKNDLVSAPKGCHSVIGKHSNLTEYIVYRYGQALPYLKIIYTA